MINSNNIFEKLNGVTYTINAFKDALNNSELKVSLNSIGNSLLSYKSTPTDMVKLFAHLYSDI